MREKIPRQTVFQTAAVLPGAAPGCAVALAGNRRGTAPRGLRGRGMRFKVFRQASSRRWTA